MKLQLTHGRLDPTQETEGTEGTIVGPNFEISGMRSIYGCHAVEFDSPESLATAKAQTGWPNGIKNNTLEMLFFEDMVITTVNNITTYFFIFQNDIKLDI